MKKNVMKSLKAQGVKMPPSPVEREIQKVGRQILSLNGERDRLVRAHIEAIRVLDRKIAARRDVLRVLQTGKAGVA